MLLELKFSNSVTLVFNISVEKFIRLVSVWLMISLVFSEEILFFVISDRKNEFEFIDSLYTYISLYNISWNIKILNVF